MIVIYSHSNVTTRLQYTSPNFLFTFVEILILAKKTKAKNYFEPPF